jgi:hypothetical protein
MTCYREAFFGEVRGKGWPRSMLDYTPRLTEFRIELRPKKNDHGNGGYNALLQMQCDNEDVDETDFPHFDNMSAFEFAVAAVTDCLMITSQPWSRTEKIQSNDGINGSIPDLSEQCDTSNAFLLFECRGMGKLRDRQPLDSEWVEFNVRPRLELKSDVTRPSSVSVIVRKGNKIAFDIAVFDTDALRAFYAGIRLVCSMITVNPQDFGECD